MTSDTIEDRLAKLEYQYDQVMVALGHVDTSRMERRLAVLIREVEKLHKKAMEAVECIPTHDAKLRRIRAVLDGEDED